MKNPTNNGGRRLSDDDVRRRRQAHEHATANARLEGQLPSPESEEIFETFIRGEIEIDKVIVLLKARHGIT